VNEAVVEPAEQHEVVPARLAAVRPVPQVMRMKAVAPIAAGEAAMAVAPLES
jgi:hypothetical protein